MHLIFDTETTGKADFKQPPDHPSQPRMVQLAALLLDKAFNEVATVALIIKPEGYTIDNSSEAVAKHHITQEIATQYGVSEKATLLLFSALCKRATSLVAHNIQFDAIVIGKAMSIHQLDFAPPVIKYCTMNAMTNLCRLPGKYGNFKWPTLAEAYHHAFQKDFAGAHNTLHDVRACAEIYKWLQTRPMNPA